MTGPAGNSEFCFPSTSMFPSGSARETLRVSAGKQNSLFPFEAFIKFLLSTAKCYRQLENVVCEMSCRQINATFLAVHTEPVSFPKRKLLLLLITTF